MVIQLLRRKDTLLLFIQKIILEILLQIYRLSLITYESIFGTLIETNIKIFVFLVYLISRTAGSIVVRLSLVAR